MMLGCWPMEDVARVQSPKPIRFEQMLFMGGGSRAEQDESDKPGRFSLSGEDYGFGFRRSHELIEEGNAVALFLWILWPPGDKGRRLGSGRSEQVSLYGNRMRTVAKLPVFLSGLVLGGSLVDAETEVLPWAVKSAIE